jgi:hypothetical protein
MLDAIFARSLLANANRARQAFADLGLGFALDAPREGLCHLRVLLHPVKAARHLVNRHGVFHRNGALELWVLAAL